MNLYVVKVEPHRAILEADYFIRQIEAAEQSRDEEVEKVEAGFDEKEEGTQEAQVNDWGLLQASSNEEYL